MTFTGPRTGRRRTVLLGVLVIIAFVLGGLAWWAWPTSAGCEAQIEAEVVRALGSADHAGLHLDTDRTHFWRCLGRSDADLTSIQARVVNRHWTELLGKGLSGVGAG